MIFKTWTLTLKLKCHRYSCLDKQSILQTKLFYLRLSNKSNHLFIFFNVKKKSFILFSFISMKRQTVTFSITFFSINMHVVLHYCILIIIHQIMLKKDEDTERKEKEMKVFTFSDINTFKVAHLYLSLLLIVVIIFYENIYNYIGLDIFIFMITNIKSIC